MKQNIKMLLGLVGLFSVATIANAGMYVGTSAESVETHQSLGTTLPSQSIGKVPDQIDTAAVSSNCQPYSGKGPLPPQPCPGLAPEPVAAEPVVYNVNTGSLKSNVEHMVDQSGWGKVIWTLPVDYNWVGNVAITSDNIQGALSKLLASYPVQAEFYEANHIVAVIPRRHP